MIREIRNDSFTKRIPYDQELRKLVEGEPSHWFLTNPASQNTYLYQVEFVRAFSEYHFKKRFSDLSILDWGCGKGHVTFLLRRNGARYIKSCDYLSVDNHDDDSSFGQKVPIIEAEKIQVDQLHDAVKLPYSDNSFDVVLSVGVLEHVQSDKDSLKELRRVLKPNAILFCFNLPYYFSWTQRLQHMRGNYYHDRLYRKADVKRLLNDSGFSLVDMWHRQILPKNTVKYPCYQTFEYLDSCLVRFTLLRYLATNIEFVALATKD